MIQYQNLMREVLSKGTKREDRTGVGTTSIFGHQMRFDLQKGFPMVTTKKLHMKSVIFELLWFLRGDTNIKFLQDNKVSIWDEWADDNGDLGPVYGKQWRSWVTPDGKQIDQITKVIEQIKTNPNSRRHMVVAYNPSDVDQMALPPCHAFFQFYVADGKLSCQLYQRSADVFLGVPFNIASYALLTHMVAQVTNLQPGEFIHTLGDAHLYSNHIEQAQLQLSREPKPLPKLQLNPLVKNIFDFKFEDIQIVGYDSHPPIKAEIAVQMSEPVIFSAIAACSKNRVIGINNKLPWSIPEDLKFFREKTKGHIMILGRKTFDSIGGKPLPGGRLHIVVTRQKDYRYSHPDVIIVQTMDQAIQEAKKHVGKFPAEIFVVGGGEIYQQSLPYLDRVYLTMIDTTVDGDSFFPELPTATWKLVSERKVLASPSYSFEVWEPKA